MNVEETLRAAEAGQPNAEQIRQAENILIDSFQEIGVSEKDARMVMDLARHTVNQCMETLLRNAQMVPGTSGGILQALMLYTTLTGLQKSSQDLLVTAHKQIGLGKPRNF